MKHTFDTHDTLIVTAIALVATIVLIALGTVAVLGIERLLEGL